MVSVCMITYNHELYIAKAIESVLMQKTTFPIELVLGEDCSTDNTKSICENYQKKHPQIVRLLDSKRNLGINKNFIRTLKSCKGKYIAVLEGDDYWTNPLKLQKQVDFLETHEDFSICFHKVKVLTNSKLTKDTITRVPGSVSTIQELGRKNYIQTPSCLFRKDDGVISKMNFYKDLNVGDYPLHIYNTKLGKIKYMDESMAVYRKHSGSNWSKKDGKHIVENFNDLLERLIQSGDFPEIEHLLKSQLLDNLWSYFMQNLNKDIASDYLQKIIEEDTGFLLEKFRSFFDNSDKSRIEKIVKKIYFQLLRNKTAQ